MVPWGSSIRRRDQRWRHTFLDLFQKYHFFPMWFMPTNPHWSAAAWGTCCGHSPCPQRLCTMVSAPDHPLYAYLTPTAVVPGRKTFIFQPCASAEAVLSTPAICPLPPHPQSHSLLMPQGPRLISGPLDHSQQDQTILVRGWPRSSHWRCCCAHRSPHGLHRLDSVCTPP